jgi:predicted heme/steroid binding protein
MQEDSAMSDLQTAIKSQIMHKMELLKEYSEVV